MLWGVTILTSNFTIYRLILVVDSPPPWRQPVLSLVMATCLNNPWRQPVRKSWVGRRAMVALQSLCAPHSKRVQAFQVWPFSNLANSADVSHRNNVSPSPPPSCDDDSGHTSEECSKAKRVRMAKTTLPKVYLIFYIEILWHLQDKTVNFVNSMQCCHNSLQVSQNVYKCKTEIVLWNLISYLLG